MLFRPLASGFSHEPGSAWPKEVGVPMFEKTATLFFAAAGIALFGAAGAANASPVSDCQSSLWLNGTMPIGTKTVCSGFSDDGDYWSTITKCYDNGNCKTSED